MSMRYGWAGVAMALLLLSTAGAGAQKSPLAIATFKTLTGTFKTERDIEMFLGSGRSETRAITGPSFGPDSSVNVVRLIPPKLWIGRAQTYIVAAAERNGIPVADWLAGQAFQTWIAELRLATGKHVFAEASALYAPCLGGDLAGGPHKALPEC